MVSLLRRKLVNWPSSLVAALRGVLGALVVLCVPPAIIVRARSLRTVAEHREYTVSPVVAEVCPLRIVH